LRGGLDNIRVVILRIGPWVEPDTAEDVATAPVGQVSSNGKKGEGGGWRAGLAKMFSARQRAPVPEVVEDRPYRSADCPINAELVERFSELTRRVQSHAIEQAWSLDWTEFARCRRLESEARAAGNLRGALKYLGEMIALLGVAARFHRKIGA
jgi:protein phosphatase